ncbi:hypothetical protein A2U01_0092434 [Trifolium medium]|uniref:Uncharacterized protein n=1 Tax=Trifolium medium TaxID=97028 RepID=A0A392UCC1_9FABA|nr:hypothetical protein [Trifolium medium]
MGRVLRLQKGLTVDAPFVNSIEEHEWCHKEVVERLSGQIWVLKESIQVQEETLTLSLSE